jgi:hypothetical protein
MTHRNTALVEPSEVSVDWRNLAREKKCPPDAYCPLGSFYVFESRYIEEHMLETPLNRRAWVMQEQQLSPRLLHFGKHQLFWHCWGDPGGRGQACETLPKGTPYVPGFRRAHQHGLQMLIPADFRQTLGINMYLEWHLLIMAYSRCEITHESDRLIAISGLASKFAEASGTTVKSMQQASGAKVLPSLCVGRLASSRTTVAPSLIDIKNMSLHHGRGHQLADTSCS